MQQIEQTRPDTSAPSAGAVVPDSQQRVLDAMEVRRIHGVHKVTAGDIRELLEQMHAPRRFDKGWVTARLSDLLECGLVVQLDEHQVNPLTKRSSQLWALPVHQDRLCA